MRTSSESSLANVLPKSEENRLTLMLSIWRADALRTSAREARGDAEVGRRGRAGDLGDSLAC